MLSTRRLSENRPFLRRKVTHRIYATVSRSLLAQLVALTLAQFLSGADAPGSGRHTVIAASGDTAPAGGNYVFFLSSPASNTPGRVAFDAFLGGPSHSGVFVSDGRTTAAIALGGDPDPAAGNFGFAFAPSLTTRGDVIFITDTGFFRGDGRRAVPLVQSGDPAPGGGSLNLGGGYAANSQGVIAYQTFVTGAVATQGIFRNDDTHTIAITLDTTVPPTGGTFFLLGQPVIDERGEVAFKAEMTGGSVDFAIFRGDGENLTTIFAANQPAPGGRSSFSIGHNKRPGVGFALNNAVGPPALPRHGRDAVAIAISGGAQGRTTAAGTWAAQTRWSSSAEFERPRSGRLHVFDRRRKPQRHFSWGWRRYLSLWRDGARDDRDIRLLRRIDTGGGRESGLHRDIDARRRRRGRLQQHGYLGRHLGDGSPPGGPNRPDHCRQDADKTRGPGPASDERKPCRVAWSFFRVFDGHCLL